MKNMKVSTKLITGFLIVAVLTAIVGGVGILGMMQINDGSTLMYYGQTRPLTDIAAAQEYFQRCRVQLRNMVIATGDVDELNSIEADKAIREEGFISYMEEYRPTLTTEIGERLYNETMAAFREYQEGSRNLLAAAKNNEDQAVLVEMMNDMRPPTDQVMDNLSTLMELRVDMATENNYSNDATFDRMLIIIVIVIIIAVAVAITLALYISGLISKPLLVLSSFMNKAGKTGDIQLSPADEQAISKFAVIKDEIGQAIAGSSSFVKHVTEIAHDLDLIAGGDLTINVEVLSNDDVMGKSLQSMLENLNTMFGEINSATGQVSTGSKQIADGAQSLAQGSTEQAASVEELSASIGEIAQKTKENATMAERAASLAGTIMQNAEKGSNQMSEMTTAVQEINQASQSISKVIKVIDDIAFQTNILALNAAVEAARAGQHGKGFAVVAEEVRNLASKSSEAAKDTGALIQNSMEKAELGARIAGETAESLADIVSGINESSVIVGDIARSSEEQSLGISQINTGIDQVAQVVQQNSATAQQSAAASEQMSSQSTMLEELISQFKLKNSSNAMRGLPSFSKKPSAPLPPAAPIDGVADIHGGDFGKY
ncbi:MAG: methyl-accepting chemotaxis protein [Oscillospiraceae bacterium]|jgi:methyl-accepting chemotaxis protein|nr:methyl-accepting chemotaxis protein [Oscillospiraceae bacterium]